MKNARIVRAWDSVNPTPAQKRRMRAALEAQLVAGGKPKKQPAPVEDDITTMDFSLSQSEQNTKKTGKPQKPRPRYQAVQPKKHRGSAFAVIAAMLAVVVAGGLFLGVMKGNQKSSYARPIEDLTAPTTEATEAAKFTELPAAYQEIVQTYVAAIEENWDPTKCTEHGICYLVKDVDSLDALGYALLDLDGNGVEELIITDGDMIYNMYTLSSLEEASWLIQSLERDRFYLSKDNLIVSIGSNSAAVSTYHFGKFNGSGVENIDSITYNAGSDPENPWFRGMAQDPISEEEANAIIASYPHRYISHTTLSGDAPLPEGKVPEEETLKRYAQKLPDLLGDNGDWTVCLYCFYDFNADGESELLLGAGNAIYAVLVEDSQGSVAVNAVTGLANIYFCEDGVMERIGYDQGRTYHEYERVDGMQIDYVSTDGENWYTQEGKTISQEEAEAIRGKYKHLNLPWKDISQFPAEIPESSGTQASTLFENGFLLLAADGTQITRGELISKMEEKGFRCEIGGDIVMCWDQEISGANLGAVFTAENDSGMINLLNYVLPGEVPRRVQVEWKDDEILYFTSTDVDNRFIQVRVDSVEELQSFLTADAETLYLRETAENFAGAYFNGNGDIWIGDIQIEKITGLEDAEARYAEHGFVEVAMAAYIDSPDSYTFLTMKLQKENGEWKVVDSWLEK